MDIDGAVIRNCYRGISLNDFPLFHVHSKFKNIHFVTDDDYKISTAHSETRHFTAWNEKGFTIDGCTFEDLRSNVYMNQRFSGIHTLAAGYDVNNCTFKNLRRGVNAGNEFDLPDRMVQVYNCNFDTLKEGVNIIRMSGNVLYSNFSFHNSVSTSAGIANILWQKEWGVYLEKAKGSYIHYNTMSGKANTLSNPLQYGVVSDCEYYNNTNIADIYSNAPYRLAAGVQTQGKQTNTHIFCNTFSNNAYGLAINPQSTIWGNTLNHQGTGLNVNNDTRPSNQFYSNNIDIGCWFGTSVNVNYYATTDIPATVPATLYNPNGSLNLITGPLTGSGAESSCDRLSLVLPANATWTNVVDAVDDFGICVASGNRNTTEGVTLYNWIIMALAKLDTTVTREHIRNFLETDNHDDSRLMLAGLYYHLNETEHISGVLSSLDSFSSDEKAIIQDYYALLIAVKSSERRMNELDSLELATLHSWADTNLYISAFAKAWLETHYDEVWLHYVEDIPMIDMSSRIKIDKEGSGLGNATPNPATNTTTIDVYIAPADEGRRPTLVLRDAMGREHFRKDLKGGNNYITINTEKLASGMYIYSLVVNEKELESKKLSVAR